MTMMMVYEQPLSEIIRVALRIEHLFQQADCVRTECHTVHHSRVLMKLLIDLLNLLDRPDLKSKLSKEFSRLIAIFSHLQSVQGVSQQMLQETIQQLKYMMTGYLDTRGKTAELLRMNGFLSNIRHMLLNVGGDSPMDAPRYWLWLNQPLSVQKEQFNRWFDQFKNIRAAIDLLLTIVRQAAEPKPLIAEKGFYHQALDAQLSLPMIRVGIERDCECYPEISAGRHRVIVRFMQSNVEERPRQIMADLPFELTLCVI